MTQEDLSTPTTTVSADRQAGTLSMERVFDAPRDLVWKAYTEADRIEKWWGPREWPTTVKRMEVRPGGIWHYCMTGPDGAQSWARSVYQEIVEPERLVYTDAFSDAEGTINEQMPALTVVVEFIDEGGKTRVRSTSQMATPKELETLLNMGVVEGMSETLDRLAEYLAAA